jgi:DNA-binding NarL/FixJ family response regulator
MIRLAIVDDQSIICEGLKKILETYEDICVVATGENGREAIELCRKYTVDVLLLDIRMPVLNGVESVKLIKECCPDIKIIMLTTFDDEEYIIQAISSGASGYLFKDIHYDTLAQSIRNVYIGQFIMPQKVAQVLIKNLKSEKTSLSDKYSLTERENEILDLLKQSFSNKQIANALFISEGTVKNYVSNIYVKTNTKDRNSLLEMLRAN